MSADFYLVSEGDRTLALAAYLDDRLFCYIPNVDAFVYNKPLTVDFLIDRTKTYKSICGHAATAIIDEGRIGRIDDRDSTTLTRWATSEPHRLRPHDVLDSRRPGAERNP